MKIRIDLHNPLRGVVSCTHCGTPMIHMDDDWHHFLAQEVAKSFGENYDRMTTPAKYFPAMMKKAAGMLANKADHILFCQYCGEALQQPRISNITEKPVLPHVYGNNFKAIKKWVEKLYGFADLPIDDYHKWSDMSYSQSRDCEVKWNGGN